MEITGIQPRLYQEQIFHTATKGNTLVVIPTGVGKTMIALMLAIHTLKQNPDSKILFLAPTKPLCHQHLKTFKKHISGIDENAFVLITGEIKPDERELQYKSAKFIFATPQTITNDLISRKIDFSTISLLVIDEAHRAIGDYDYVFLAKQYMDLANAPKILALTASPGSDKSTINQICANLFIKNIEVRDEESPDVKEYVQQKEIEKIMILLPDSLKEIMEMFQRSLARRLKILKERGALPTADVIKVRKTELLNLQKRLAVHDRGDWTKMQDVSTIAACVKIMHCLELLQTQGIKPLAQFLEGMKKEIKRVKANRCLFEDLEFKEAMRRVFDLEAKNIEHPKFEKLVSIVNNFKKPKSRIIIFTHYRNTADRIITFLTEQTNSKPVKFIGQKSGMSQKEQVQVINDFKDGIYNVLVATSIAEEGLHIENADLGIFFEPVPSALRTIQRRGRIGRVNIGKIILLITKDTIDEKYFWVAFHKERRMKETLDEIREEIKDGAQSRLTGF